MRRAIVAALVLAGSVTTACQGVSSRNAACVSDSQCPTGTYCGASGFCNATSPLDAGSAVDSGVPDSGPLDSGPADAGPSDSGPADAGPSTDAGPSDSGPTDAGRPDSGPGDAGAEDAGPTDSGPPPLPGPVAPNTVAGGPITYVKVPWGSQATNRDAGFTVLGAGGAASGDVSVIAFDGLNTAISSQIATGAVNADGGFTITLPADPSSGVFLAGVGQDGGLSPAEPIHNFVWTATFDGKTPGNTTTNPHVLTTTQDFLLTSTALDAGYLQGPLSPPLNYSGEATSYAPLSLADGQSITTSTEYVWGTQAPVTPPSNRGQHSAAYDTARQVMVVFGGCSDTTCATPLNQTWEWDGLTWAVKAPTTSPPGRGDATLAYDAARGVTLLFGGCTTYANPGACQVLDNSTWAWDGIDWTNVTPGTSPSIRSGHSMASDHATGNVVLFGGANNQGVLKDTWAWNGSSWTSIDGAVVNIPGRTQSAMVYDDATGELVLFGGMGSGGLLNDTWVWSSTESGWTSVTPSPGNPADNPSPRAGLALAYDAGRGVVVLFGGQTGGSPLSDLWEWNGTAWSTRTPTGTSAPGRSQASMVYDAKEGVVTVYGGESGAALGDLWTWNGTLWMNGTLTGLAPTNRQSAGMAYDSAHLETVLFGGYETSSAAAVNDTWLWSGFAWTSVTPTTMPGARMNPAMASDASGNTFLFGGSSGLTSGYLNDTWRWDGTNWTNVSPGTITSTNNPSVRAGARMVFDSVRKVFVLVGGYNGSTYPQDTWQWQWSGSAGSWTNVSPPSPNMNNNISGRVAPAVAYDASHQQVVAFGGFGSTMGSGTATFGDTWVWSPGSMTWANETGSNPGTNDPMPRQEATMVYDSVRGVSVLFGGLTGMAGNTADGDDTWEWNGSAWADVAPELLGFSVSNPQARDSQMMVYDSALERTFLFGGEGMGADIGAAGYDPSDPERRPAQIATFSFTAASPAIQQMSFTAYAGGVGDTLVIPGGGAASNGASLAAWDAWSGEWKVLQTNSPGPGAPQAMTYSATGLEAPRYLLAVPQTISLAMFPTVGRGNGSTVPQVAVDYVELTVGYQQ